MLPLSEIVLLSERVHLVSHLVHHFHLVIVVVAQAIPLLIEHLLDPVLDSLLELVDLDHFLLENLSVIIQVVGEGDLVMLSTVPALG